MYHTQAHSGSSPDFWEENWETLAFTESVTYCAVDPLRPLFEKYLRPDSMMLEGGCGMGNYVSYYAGRGFNVIGLDFAQNTLKKLHVRQPRVKLCGGNVSRLPFADKTFDLYYSGGVVEHFEGGAEVSLKEARRVIRDDGILMISVPFYSPLRKILSPFKNSEWRILNRPEVDENGAHHGKKFFQYAYTRNEFSEMLRAAGLNVIDTRGYAVLWGLYEIPFLKPRHNDGIAAKYAQPARKENGEVNIQPLLVENDISFLQRLVVCEDASVPALGLGVKFFRWAAANMMMYVCKRSVSN